MNCCCDKCGNLDKTKKTSTNGCYRYGCKNGSYICGWISKDTELKTMGCSGFIEKSEESEQISLF